MVALYGLDLDQVLDFPFVPPAPPVKGGFVLTTIGRILAGLAAFGLMCWHYGRRAHRVHIANCIRKQLS